MPKFALLLGVLALIAGKAFPQHCPYDGSKIMVLAPTASERQGTIPGLKITVLDSAGRPVLQHSWFANQLVGDTLRFWQNTAKSRGKPPKHYAVPGYRIRFWFALDHYVLVASHVPRGAKIRLEDPDGASNGGPFQTQTVELNERYFFPLCTGHSHWDWPENPSFVADYRPVKIRMRKSN